MICSRVRCITKENTIDRPSFKLIQLLPVRKNETLATKDMVVTHLGCVTMHQLITGFLLMHSLIDPVQNIARGVHRLSQEPSRSPMLIKHHPSYVTQGSVFPFHNTILGGVYRLENWCSRPKSWQKVSKREFLNSEPLSLRIAHMTSSCLSFFNLQTRSQTKPNVSPFS
jgi:hypothetical protein